MVSVDLDLLKQQLPEKRTDYIDSIDLSLTDVIESYKAVGNGSDSEKGSRIEKLRDLRKKVEYSEYAVALGQKKAEEVPGVTRAIAPKLYGQLEYALEALRASNLGTPGELDALSKCVKTEFNRIREETKAGVIAYLQK